MNDLPLMNHPLSEPTAFRPEDLVDAVRQQRGKGNGSIPPLGVLEFDGDLIDKLIARGEVRRCEDWPCFQSAQQESFAGSLYLEMATILSASAIVG